MKIGILGCGYVGTALAIRFQEKGHELHLTTTTRSKVPILSEFAQKVHLLRVQQSAKFHAFLDEIEALFITVAPLPGINYEDTYLLTAKALQSALKNHGGQISFIGYTSTTSVYGQHNGEWVDENSEIHAISPNSESLVKAEEIYRHLELPTRHMCILRLGELYGPGRELEQRIKRMSGSTLPGRGQTYTNLVHIEDIVAAFIFCLEHKIAGTFNLCNHTHLLRKDLYSSVCRTHGWPAPSWDGTDSVATFKQNKRVNSSKLESLGFRLQYPQAFEWLTNSSQSP